MLGCTRLRATSFTKNEPSIAPPPGGCDHSCGSHGKSLGLGHQLTIAMASVTANVRWSGGLDRLGRESGVRDRHGRALRTGQSFNLGIELMRQRLDYAG